MDLLLNKTMSLADLRLPEVAAQARRLRRLALGLGLRRIPFAVNGILKWRVYVRRHKLWEYARGMEYGDFHKGMRVLDFGGAATLPIFHLARQGCEVLSLDIDPKLTDYTNAVAEKHRWPLRASTHDLTAADPPADWGQFDRVISFCVIEHIHKPLQPKAMERLASLLKPGGMLQLTFDYGEHAPAPGALRNASEVRALAAASGLALAGNPDFLDTGERFPLDKKHPARFFTFGSLFLRK
jgi:SAM-dependent methyltransferase